jgi:DNA-binding IclR family transcriptional regulator
VQQTVSRPGTLIQSVQRASALLKAFEGEASELGVTELGRKVKLHKSTVSRLLATLESEGLVERAPGTDKYRLGYEFARLARQVPHFGDVREAARPFLAELAELSHETANLAVRDGDEVINVEQASGPHLIGVGNWVGRRTPLHCVANGKVLLAFQSEAEIKRLLGHALPKFTKQTITGKTALRTELARVREKGYAIARGEMEDGLNAIAAPIREGQGNVIAAVSLSGPAFRLTPEQMAKFEPLTVEMAKKISARLGFTA